MARTLVKDDQNQTLEIDMCRIQKEYNRNMQLIFAGKLLIQAMGDPDDDIFCNNSLILVNFCRGR